MAGKSKGIGKKPGNTRKSDGRKDGGTNGGGTGNPQQQSFPVVSDSRFASMHSAPAFQRVKADDRKVKLDDRFKAVLTDPRFQVSASADVDKYGRKVSKSSKKAEGQLRAFYKVDDGDDGDDANPSGSDPHDAAQGEEEGEERDEEPNEESDEESDEDQAEEQAQGSEEDEPERGEESRQAYLTRLSRGEISGDSFSSDTSDDEGDDSDDGGAEGMHELDSDGGGRQGLEDPSREAIPVSEETSRRLAVTNCDWDNMRARDLIVLCGSFCPASARLSSVTVYPSDFGLKMMRVEAAAGPHAALASNGENNLDGDREDESEASDDSMSGERKEGTTAIPGVSTSAGTAVDGRVVKRRRPGVIIEDYRVSGTADGSSDDEEGGKEGCDDERALEQKGEETKGSGAGQNSQGFDPEKLRVYELRKLKYYFAVLECSSTAAAEAIYREVDGMEFEHSSVALDLRFIPDGVSFKDRTVRDRSTSVPSSYQPPSFICKALQQTNVECTWDEAPTERKVLLNRISQWRDAAEEDFEAYLASSSEESSDSDADASDDSSEDEDGLDETSSKSKSDLASTSKQKVKSGGGKARQARKLLLQDALGLSGDSGSSDGDHDDMGGFGSGDDPESGEEFTYTSKTGADRGNESAVSGLGEGEEEEGADTEFTFVPRGAADEVDSEGGEAAIGGVAGAERLLARRKQKEALARETPWEASLRKERERKKARKKAIKERIEAEEAGEEDDESEAGENDDDFFLEESSGGRGASGKNASSKNKDSKQRRVSETNEGVRAGNKEGGVSMEDVLGGDDEDEEDKRDYDMHQLAREEKVKGKKLRGKRKRKEMAREKAPGQDFRVDVGDERFAAVLEGDTRFGIDRTDTSFKDTEGMRQILDERSRRKDKRGMPASDSSSRKRSNGHADNKVDRKQQNGGVESTRKNNDMSSMINKLKGRALPNSRGGSVVSGAAGVLVGGDGGGANASGGKGRRGKKKRRKA